MTTLANTMFPCYKGDCKSSGQVSVTFPSQIRRIKWKKTGTWGQPVFLENGNLVCIRYKYLMYIPSNLVCIDPVTGNTIWESETFDFLWITPERKWITQPSGPVVINGNRILVNTNQPGIIYCIDGADGSTIWKQDGFDTNHTIDQPTIGPGGKIYTLDNEEATVYRISDDGEIETTWNIPPRWGNVLNGRISHIIAADSNQVVFMVSHSERFVPPYDEAFIASYDSLHGYDQDGTELWYFECINGPHPSDTAIEFRYKGAAIAPNGNIYVAPGPPYVFGDLPEGDGYSYLSILHSTGVNLVNANLCTWFYDSDRYFSIPSIDSSGNVYLIDSCGRLYKRNMWGAHIWYVDLPLLDSAHTIAWNTPYIDVNGNILVESSWGHGYIFCVSPSGDILWDTIGLHLSSYGSSYWSPIADNDGHVFYATDIYLYCLDEISTVLLNPRTGICTSSPLGAPGDRVTINLRTGVIRKSVSTAAAGDVVTYDRRTGTIRKSR